MRPGSVSVRRELMLLEEPVANDSSVIESIGQAISDYRIDRPGISAIFGVAVIGITMKLPHPWIAGVCALVTTMCAGWSVWRVGLRLMRHQTVPRGSLTIWQYLSIANLLLGLASLFAMLMPASLRLAEYLSFLGPIGWLTAQIQSIGTGDFTALVPLSAFVFVSGLCGWWVARDAGSWRNRRKLIQSQRGLAVVSPTEAREPAEPQRFERRDLEFVLVPSMVDRRYRQWRFWLTPAWLRRRWAWYIVIAVVMLIFQTVLVPLQLIVARADTPVPVLAHGAEIPAVSFLTGLAVVSLAVMLFAIEVMALFDA